MSVITEIISSLLLFFLVYGMSATVEISHIIDQMKNWKALLIGCCMQFVILPFIGFVSIRLFALSAPVGITLLVITSSPGGSYSNWWCSMFNAELALSVTMTAVSTLLSTVMLPFNLYMYTHYTYDASIVQSLDWYALFISICTVIGGITCGLITSAYAKQSNQSVLYHKRAHRLGNIAGLSLIGLSIIVSSTANNNNNNNNTTTSSSSSTPIHTHQNNGAVWNQSWTFYIGCAMPAIIGIFCVTYLTSKVGKLEKPERVAVGVESCYQNLGIATSVALTMFSNTTSNNTGKSDTTTSNDITSNDDLALAMGVPLYYGIVEAMVLFIFCIICWKISWTKAPANENLCVILSTSYEVDELEHKVILETLQQEDTAIEVVMGTSDNNKTNANDTGCHDLIFTQTDHGDYIVDENTLQEVVYEKQQQEQQHRRKRLDSETSVTLSEEEHELENNNNHDDGDYNHDDGTTKTNRTPLTARLATMFRRRYESRGINDNNTPSNEIEMNEVNYHHRQERTASPITISTEDVENINNNNNNNNNNIHNNDIIQAEEECVNTNVIDINNDINQQQEQPEQQQHNRRTERLHRTILRVRARAAGYHHPDRNNSMTSVDSSNDNNNDNYDDETDDNNIYLEQQQSNSPVKKISRRRRVVVVEKHNTNDNDEHHHDNEETLQHLPSATMMRGNILRRNYQTIVTSLPQRDTEATSSNKVLVPTTLPTLPTPLQYHYTDDHDWTTSSSSHHSNNSNDHHHIVIAADDNDHYGDDYDDEHHHHIS